MNIFWLDDDPLAAAKAHHDDHCDEMIVRSARLLAGALRQSGVCVSGLYGSQFTHPCLDWVKSSRGNADWLLAMARALTFEWMWRGFEPHQTFDQLELCAEHLDALPKGPLTPPVLVMPPAFVRSTPVESYRNFYCGAQAWIADPVREGRPQTYHAATWRRRDPPKWWEPYQPHPLEDDL